MSITKTYQRARGLVFLLAIVAIIIPQVVKYFDTEERRIRGRIGEVASIVATPPKEAELARLARVARLRPYFASGATVFFETDDQPTLHGPDEIVAATGTVVGHLGPFKVETKDMNVSVHEGNEAADVWMKVRLVSRDPGMNPSTIDERDISAAMKKIGGAWVVAEAHIKKKDVAQE